MPVRKNKPKKRRNSQKLPGTDSLVITSKEITKRNSIVSSAVCWDEPELKKISEKEIQEIIEKEEECFKRAMERELDETKYVVQKKLKTGGMGEVYYVFDRDFQRHSAMKVIIPELKQDSRAIDSFITEARITGELEHPNIIPVHDLGFFPGRGIYFTMKLMKGEPLNHVLQKVEIGDQEYLGKYDLYMLLSIFRKVCDAVAFAHSKKILHRDIKPHNIMVGDYGEVLLMDWGLSKRLGENGAKKSTLQLDENVSISTTKSPEFNWSTTELGVVKGSPAFMSPEQALGDIDAMDERSDIFLLGATLYHIFTFYPPYLGDDVYEIVSQARNHELIPPDELGTGRFEIPVDLTRIIMKALAKDKKDRYSKVSDLSSDIDAFLRGEINFRHQFFKKNEYLMHEGESGSESYIIVKGKVRVEKNVKNKKISISTLKKGDIVGEMSIITSEPRSASVIAIENTEVMVLDRDLFTEYLTKSPPWLSKTFVTLAERLKAATNKHAV